MPPGGFAFFGPLFGMIGIVVLGKGLLCLAAGWGLMQKRPWARTIALVAAFISLFSVPVGTALGVYTIWVLMAQGAEQEYARLAGAGV